MNNRLLYTVLFVQFIFAVGLIVVGTRSREDRRASYLEITHRVTSGYATEEHFTDLSASLAQAADAQAVRALLGPPLAIASKLELGENEKLETKSGTFWLYYVLIPPNAPVDPGTTNKLTGPVRCFVIEFDVRGRPAGRLAWVKHPL